MTLPGHVGSHALLLRAFEHAFHCDSLQIAHLNCISGQFRGHLCVARCQQMGLQNLSSAMTWTSKMWKRKGKAHRRILILHRKHCLYADLVPLLLHSCIMYRCASFGIGHSISA